MISVICIPFIDSSSDLFHEILYGFHYLLLPYDVGSVNSNFSLTTEIRVLPSKNLFSKANKWVLLIQTLV